MLFDDHDACHVFSAVYSSTAPALLEEHLKYNTLSVNWSCGKSVLNWSVGGGFALVCSLASAGMASWG